MKCTVVYGVLAARVIDMDSIDMRSATLDGYDRQCGSDGAMKKGSEMKQPSNKNFGHQRRTGCESVRACTVPTSKLKWKLNR